MKHFSTILNLALLFLVGLIFVHPAANCQPTISASPSLLQFAPIPVGAHSDTSYVLTVNSGSSTANVYITIPTNFKIGLGDTSYWWSVGKFFTTVNPATIKIIVRYTPTDSAGANETIINSMTVNTTPFVANVTVVGSPLPIQLASFKATAINSKNVTLTWSTFSETNNYGFYVQRNGVDLTFIAGHGTTLDQHSYSYTDNPSPGKYQYRLKQVDLDGAATLSESVVIDVTVPVKFALNQNYPNPFNPSTKVAFSITKEGPVSLRVYDVLGREVATLVNENRKPGQYAESFNGSQMASGMYLYVLRSSEGQLIGRMMLLK